MGAFNEGKDKYLNVKEALHEVHNLFSENPEIYIHMVPDRISGYESVFTSDELQIVFAIPKLEMANRFDLNNSRIRLDWVGKKYASGWYDNKGGKIYRVQLADLLLDDLLSLRKDFVENPKKFYRVLMWCISPEVEPWIQERKEALHSSVSKSDYIMQEATTKWIKSNA